MQKLPPKEPNQYIGLFGLGKKPRALKKHPNGAKSRHTGGKGSKCVEGSNEYVFNNFVKTVSVTWTGSANL